MPIRSAPDDVVVPIMGSPGAPGPTADTCPCRPERHVRAHHDRLLHVEAEPDEVLELLELAVTWRELDWSGEGVVAPEHWVEFAATHAWVHPDRMERLFGLAADIALRGADAGPTPSSCSPGRVRTIRPWLADADLLAGEL